MRAWAENLLAVILVIGMIAAGVWAGGVFTWGFILFLSAVLLAVLAGIFVSIGWEYHGNQPIVRGFIMVGIVVFLLSAWAACIITLTGVFRK